MLFGSPLFGQQLPPAVETEATTGQQQPDQSSSGSISGTVLDPSGAAVAGAQVKLAREDQSQNQEAQSGEDGQFSFPNVLPGPFQLTITKEGFTAQTIPGTLRPMETYIVPQIKLTLAAQTTEVRVEPPQVEVAEGQIKEQEKQRVLSFIPNFYASYVPNAVPLTTRQKFELGWKTTVDPVSLVLTGAVAGIEQAQNGFSGYGQGAQGYGKRFGATYADFVSDTFIGSAILPSLFKQDPRYFYKGEGSIRSRILYAIANAVICKGDNGRWQANYSHLLGSLATGGLANTYYPSANRRGVGLTFEVALIGIGKTAGANLFQEFLIRKLTPRANKNQPATP